MAGVAGKLTSQIKHGAQTLGTRTTTSGALLGVERDQWGSEVSIFFILVFPYVVFVYFLRIKDLKKSAFIINSILKHTNCQHLGNQLMKEYLFRQNTYLWNKKHTLTCQGGTGCYRVVNYQPGS